MNIYVTTLQLVPTNTLRHFELTLLCDTWTEFPGALEWWHADTRGAERPPRATQEGKVAVALLPTLRADRCFISNNGRAERQSYTAQCLGPLRRLIDVAACACQIAAANGRFRQRNAWSTRTK